MGCRTSYLRKKEKADWVGGNLKTVGAQREGAEPTLKHGEEKQSLKRGDTAGRSCPGRAG